MKRMNSLLVGQIGQISQQTQTYLTRNEIPNATITRATKATKSGRTRTEQPSHDSQDSCFLVLGGGSSPGIGSLLPKDRCNAITNLPEPGSVKRLKRGPGSLWVGQSTVRLDRATHELLPF